MTWLLVKIWTKEGDVGDMDLSYTETSLLSAAAIASINLSEPRPTIWDREAGRMKALLRIDLLSGRHFVAEILESYGELPTYLLYESGAEHAIPSADEGRR